MGGLEGMAQATNRSVSTINAWRDPERREKVPLDDAIALDLAYQAAGGVGAPLFETYAAQLELAASTRFSDRHHLLEATKELVREAGEAHAALIHASQPGATAGDDARALREATEAFDRFKPILAMLSGRVPAPAGNAAVGQPRERGPP